MSFDGDKNENSVFLQNFKKRLSEFFKRHASISSTEMSNPQFSGKSSQVNEVYGQKTISPFSEAIGLGLGQGIAKQAQAQTPTDSEETSNQSKTNNNSQTRLNSSFNNRYKSQAKAESQINRGVMPSLSRVISSFTEQVSEKQTSNSSMPSSGEMKSPKSVPPISYRDRNKGDKTETKGNSNRLFRPSETTKQQVVSITYEEIGLFPRSFNRVFDRFFKQLFFDVENLVIQEYRFYRYLFLTTIKCVFILVFVPLSINFLAKSYLVRPITEHYWNSHQPEIFLNSYQQKRAFNELQDFEEKIYFESLILPNPSEVKSVSMVSTMLSSQNLLVQTDAEIVPSNFNSIGSLQHAFAPEFFSDSVQNRLHDKIVQLAVHYNEESIEAITNFFADFISFLSLCYLFFALEIQINITKSFLLEVFFGLDDSKKSLFILFLTDLLVGYHSPNIWELFFSSFFDHYGLPENQTTIFLLVATLPVLLDVLFKYLIFRHLNRASPATVATYHAMIE